GGLVGGVGALDGGAPGFLVDVLAVSKLSVDDVDLLDVLQPGRPLAGAQTDHAADDLGQALHYHERARHGDDRLKVVDRPPPGNPRRVLADAPGVRGEPAPGVDEPDHARDEEQEVQSQVEGGLAARLHVDVDEVGKDV